MRLCRLWSSHLVRLQWRKVWKRKPSSRRLFRSANLFWTPSHSLHHLYLKETTATKTLSIIIIRRIRRRNPRQVRSTTLPTLRTPLSWLPWTNSARCTHPLMRPYPIIAAQLSTITTKIIIINLVYKNFWVWNIPSRLQSMQCIPSSRSLHTRGRVPKALIRSGSRPACVHIPSTTA